MEARCRLCAENTIDQIAVLEDLELPSKIFQLFQIKINIDDKLPITICQICHDMVEKTWSFKDRAQKAQDILTDLINTILNSAQNPLPEEEIDFPLNDEKVDINCCFPLESVIEKLASSEDKNVQRIKVLKYDYKYF